ncbi:MAG: DNA polymerase III subunit beta [Candidatus Nealsonbacteria bacterium]|nr:DNA polymerase III subunit beta [Candidatus Nealsonbacteria bacterium]
MKFTVLKENLNQGLNFINRVAGKNLTLPILNNILISVEKNFLNLSATDLELGIKYWSLIKTEKEGKITVPAKILSSFINLLPEDKINLELKNQIININCQDYQTKIKGLSAEEFPIIPKIEGSNFIELNCNNFCNGLSQVVDFVVLNQNRPELSGVYFNFKKNNLTLATTDSFRLAEKVLSFEEKINQDFSFILPQKSVREIINIFSEKEGKLRFYFSQNQVLFEYLMTETPHPQVQIISRVIEGEYPDYQGIIPKKYEVQAVLSKEKLLNHIKTAGIFSGKTNEVKIKLTPQKEGIEIFSQNSESGENQSFLQGQIKYNSSPKEMEVSFNYRFIIDGLLNIKEPEVIFELNGEDGPAALKPKTDTSYIYIVMPIKSI